MRELPHTRSCFVCGESNPAGLRLRFRTDGRVVRGEFTPRPEHAGFKGVVHGGILATVLDEIMVWACAVNARKFGFCAEMNVRYQNPATPGQCLTGEAELVADRRGRVLEAKAALHNPAGQIIASATGKYMPVRDADLNELKRDLVGDVDWLFAQLG